MTEIKLKTKLSAYSKGVIPTKVSQLENDKDYTSEAPKDDKIYARKNGEWNNISTPQDNEPYTRKNDTWTRLEDELQAKGYRTDEQLDEKYINNSELDAYNTGLREFIADTYVNKETFNTTLEDYVTNDSLANTLEDYVEETALNDTLTNYVTISNLESRDYVPDVQQNILDPSNEKVYARRRGQWYWLDLENMGSINIDTPINSGLISREIPKEESHESRNKYEIQLNKFEGTLEQFETDVSNNPIEHDIEVDSYTKLKSGTKLKTGSKLNGVILNEDRTLSVDTELLNGDIIKLGSIIVKGSVVNTLKFPNIEQMGLETGKFYYVEDPEQISELLNGGSASTNEFDQAVDILTTRFQLRTDTRLNWQQNNPILEYGEPGWETDTSKLKIGDGEHAWNNLSYVYGILDNTVVDDLSVLFNNDKTSLSIRVDNINLSTQNTSSKTVNIPIVDSTQVGLMASTDYNTLQDLVSRVNNLEGKTTRLLYPETLITSDITISDDTFLKKGSILKSASVINGVAITQDTTLNEDTQLDNEDIIKTGSIIANSSLINDIVYPNATTINTFAIRQGYTAPFAGLAVVISGTYHIWHYYENEENGQVVGWKDDGIDTVSNFTNDTPGIILGSQQAGKVFAESDGTGSVYGWDNLTTNVSNLGSDVSGLQTDVGNLQSDLSDLSTSVNNLSSDVSSLSSNVNILDGNVSNLSSAVGGLDTQVQGIKNSKVTTINAQSTDATYPSTKAVYDYVNAYTPEITSLTKQEIDEM